MAESENKIKARHTLFGPHYHIIFFLIGYATCPFALIASGYWPFLFVAIGAVVSFLVSTMFVRLDRKKEKHV
jgi:uncharacterized membrane protein YgaE (UPF0421/DUF939 family)